MGTKEDKAASHTKPIKWISNNTPVSSIFDDIYFSTDNGLEESKVVFIDGIDAPQIWENKNNFTICELGFGTGLNLFNTMKFWIETTNSQQHLTYIATEKYPLEEDEIKKAVYWPELKPYVDAFLPQYPSDLNILFDGRVTVKLLFGDSAKMLSEQKFMVDAWYLDGFAPRKNPDMWSGDIFSQIERLSHHGSRVATFTAAGFVRRALSEKGFRMSKRAGYGKKREMLGGEYEGDINNVFPRNKSAL